MISNGIPSAEKLVDQYIQSVLDGERVAGELERATVDGYLRDREHAAERGWFFSEDMAAAAVNFFPLCCRHSIGEWAGEPFVLAPWQAFVTWCLFGWRSASDKSRRFRRAYVTVGRKNGKTTWAAGMACQMLFFDRNADGTVEPRSMVYCAATKRDQAALLWHEAVKMIRSSQWLDKRVVIHGERQLSGGKVSIPGQPWNDAQFVPLGCDKANSGLNPSFVVKDELHEWRSQHRELHEQLSTGGASRRNPLELIITTAGDDNSEIWQNEHEFCSHVARGMASGEIVDDTILPFICQADEDDDPLEETTWHKANPNIGSSVKHKYLQAAAQEAVAKPSALNQFLRYHCNLRVASFDQAYPPYLWKRGNRTFDSPQDGDLLFLGFDLSTTNDWSAVGMVWPQRYVDDNGDTRWRYVVRAKMWCCEGTTGAIDYSRPPFSNWIRDGLLDFQKSETLDRAPLKQCIVELLERYHVREIAYDKHAALETATDLMAYNAPLEKFTQQPSRYNEPIRSFEEALMDGRIDHGNDPVLNWQAGNSQIVYDSKGLCMINKGNQVQWKKIDGMVSILMAYGATIFHQKEEQNDGVMVT